MIFKVPGAQNGVQNGAQNGVQNEIPTKTPLKTLLDGSWDALGGLFRTRLREDGSSGQPQAPT